jgi:hypothetical protein
MPNRCLGSMIALGGVFVFAGAVFGQTGAKTAKNNGASVDPRDISGVFQATGSGITHINEPPETFLQPWALKELNAEPIALRKDLPQSEGGGETTIGANEGDISCSQISLTTFITKAKPIEIVQTPKRIFMFFEYQNTFRTIWMDGRALNKDPDPSYFGTSVGRWEGNTLVVETDGFNDRTQIIGMPHSDVAHMAERYTRKDAKTVELTFTVDDSKAYTKPFTAATKLVQHPDWELAESFCVQEDFDNFKKKVIDPAASEPK